VLRIPLLILYGGNDRHVPTWLCVERLEPLQRDHDLKVALFPRGDHFLFDTASGLSSQLAASNHYADGLWSTIDAWLAAHRLRD
jgi:pimeloyl-ACP methyl ester carboxylesterase